MAVTLSRTRSAHLHLPIKLSEQQEEITINRNNNLMLEQKKVISVPVVYYLCRNGKLEHPHFVQVPLSSPHGLFLRDVIYRLNLLRGKSMASHYSWSSKRSYKNGYVWYDLEEKDFLHPVHGGEYVLKGSEISEMLSSPSLSLLNSTETSSSSTGKINNVVSSTINSGFPESSSSGRTRRRNQSWRSIDLNEYKVYKTDSTHEFAAADASTQTDETLRRRNGVIKENSEMERRIEEISVISPPLSDSSPESLEKLIQKSDGKSIIVSTVKCETSASCTSSSSLAADQAVEGAVDRTVGNGPSGRMKASSVLMSLISCGSVSFRDCGATAVKDHGLSLISRYKPRLSRGEDRMVVDKPMKTDHDNMMMEKNVSSSFAKMALEDKEYFSGSLIENNKNNYKEDPQFISLKRSTSYNADRSSHLKLEGKEVDGTRAKCMQRRPKAQPSNRQECISETTSITFISPHGSEE